MLLLSVTHSGTTRILHSKETQVRWRQKPDNSKNTHKSANNNWRIFLYLKQQTVNQTITNRWVHYLWKQTKETGTEAGSSSATEGVVNSQMQMRVRKESTRVTFFHTNLYISKYLFAWVIFRVGCCSCASHGILLYVNKCHTLVLQFYFSLIVKLLMVGWNNISDLNTSLTVQ